jgi:uncharacterized membrane protein (UPF0127 family)
MKIFNKTRKTTLAETIITPTSLLDQFLGLLKYKTPRAMLFKTRWGIHTIGMKYAIDILILNKGNRVVTLKENLKPNNLFVWNPQFETVLELPPGKIKETKTKIGDFIKFK